MLKPVAVLLIAFAGLVSAQAPTAPTGPRLITVNVMVTKDKKPVKGLTKADFVIEDKNKAQNIAFFAVADDEKKIEGMDPAISSNRVDPQGREMGTATIFLYDRVNNEQTNQGRIRNEVLKVLAGMKPTDRIGFYSLGIPAQTNPNPLKVVRDYTEDAAPLIAAAKALQANNNGANLKPEEQEVYKRLADALSPIQELQQQQRVNVTQPAFRLIARHLQGAPGRRNVLWITSSFPLTFGGEQQERRANDEAEIETFRQILTNAGISLYPINPAGAGGGFASGSLSGQQTFQLLADATGGEAYRSANDIAQPLRDVIASTGYSYVLGFYPDNASLDDKNHNLRVTLAKKPETDKAKLSHRKDYIAWNPTSKVEAIQPLKTRVTVKEAMEQPMLETGVGLMAVANGNPQDPAVQTFDIRIDTRDLRFEPKDGKWVANLTIALGTDANGTGKMLGQEEYAAELTEEQWKEATEVGGIDIRRNVSVGAGTSGVMRIGVQDNATGTAGTVRVRYGAR
jgi:VWFA-related protein